MSLILEKREYQDQAVDLGIQFLTQKKPRNGIVIVPCGGGKSLIAARIILGLDGPAVLFQPRKELLLQNLEKLQMYGYQPSVFSASVTSKAANPRTRMRREVSEITLATIKTAISSPELFQDTKYVLIDECSEVDPAGGQYKEFQKALPKGVRYLGLDATPFRMYSNSYGTELRFLTRQKPRFFSEVVFYSQLKDLFDAGYLHRPKYFSMQKEVPFDEGKLTINGPGSDFTDDSVQRHLFEIGFNDKLADITRRLIGRDRKGILIFTRFTAEARYLADVVPGVAVVTAKTKDSERAAIIKSLREGKIKAVANVGVLSVGFDYPQLDTVILARPTMSLRVYYQQCGRPIRPHPEKTSVWIVDLVGAVKRFGKIQDLALYCEGNSGWAFWGRPGGGEEVQLTNKYFSQGGGMKCQKCGAPVQYVYNEATGYSAPLVRPTNGITPNCALVQVDGKQKYRLYSAKRPRMEGEPEPTHVNHHAVCRPGARS